MVNKEKLIIFKNIRGEEERGSREGKEIIKGTRAQEDIFLNGKWTFNCSCLVVKSYVNVLSYCLTPFVHFSRLKTNELLFSFFGSVAAETKVQHFQC